MLHASSAYAQGYTSWLSTRMTTSADNNIYIGKKGDEGNVYKWVATGFTTGAHEQGYMLHEVRAEFNAAVGTPLDLRVSIVSMSTSGGSPIASSRSTVGSLTGANPTTAGLHVFRSAAGIKLEPNTRYFVAFESASNEANSTYWLPQVITRPDRMNLPPTGSEDVKDPDSGWEFESNSWAGSGTTWSDADSSTQELEFLGRKVGEAAATGECEQGLRSALAPFGATIAGDTVRAVQTRLRHLREGLHSAAAAETGGATALEVAAHQLLAASGAGAAPDNAGFQYSASGGGGLPMALWGRMSRTRFDDLTERCGFEVDGRVDTGFLGMDFQWDADMTLGLLVSYSDGDMDYKYQSRRGMVDADMTNVVPYVHWTLDEGLYAWLYAGGGRGEAELEEEGGSGPVKTDIDMRMAAAGVRKELDDRWAVRADAFAMKIESDARAPVLLTSARAERVRVMLEGRDHYMEEKPDEQLTVRYALGARLDSGDAASGAGAEVSGDLEYHNKEAGLSVKGEGWYLLTHSEDDYEEWGASLELELDPGEPGTGPRLSIAPAWGTALDDALALWDGGAAERLNGLQPDRRLDVSLGYGFRGPQGRPLTLYGGYSYDASRTAYQAGAYWEMDENAVMTWALERSRRRGEPAETGTKFQFEMRH